MPKYILGKDFHKHVGKKILMPHPTNPSVMPVELTILKVVDKRVTLGVMIDEERAITQTNNYSKDKNKYLIIE